MNYSQRFYLPKPDKKLGDNYLLLECLGDGSYGWVWRALRLSDEKEVAIKIPKAQGSKDEDLMEGSTLIGSNPHPNIIQVFWTGRVPPECEWYVIEMEYFPGLTLSQCLEKNEQGLVASYEKILDIYLQVLKGVNHLHQVGLSHGDIKPQNILINGNQVKITDFGSSIYLSEESYVRHRDNVGTILYSAPEMVGNSWVEKDKNTLFKADIYSLGVLLYFLVTNRLPHDTPNQVSRHLPFPKPSEINTTILPELEDFILKTLSFEPEMRWKNVVEMIQYFNVLIRRQLNFHPIQRFLDINVKDRDWSIEVYQALEKNNLKKAQQIAQIEFDKSKDIDAFLSMLIAQWRDARYMDCLRYVEQYEDLIYSTSSLGPKLRKLAISIYMKNRFLDKAESLINYCVENDENTITLLLKKASLLGVQAEFEKASNLLLELNQKFPNDPAVLKRLALVFEQLRDIGKSRAFLKRYSSLVQADSWALKKLSEYQNYF